ncbi:MAG: hypothetical protein KC656_29035, partial [Myxococcales bacterium]|nr:hypothetical protein [Myxococcales bacterium]
MADWIEVRTEEVDEAGTVTAGVHHDGVRCGTLAYVAWGTSLVVSGLTLDAAAPPGTLRAVVDMLAARVRDQGLRTVYHHHVSDPEVVRAYRDGSLAAGMIATGAHAGGLAYFDPVDSLPDDLGPGAHLTLVWMADFAEAVADGLPDGVFARLQLQPSFVRIAMLRDALARGQLPAAETDAVLRYALLDSAWDVRQFAAVSFSGALGTRDPVADLPGLLDLLARPLTALDGHPTPVVPDGLVFDPVHAVRNARFAVWFVLGSLLSWTWPDEATLAQLRARVDEVLSDGLTGLTPARRRQLDAAAAADGTGADPIALGRVDDLSLLEMCRFVAARSAARRGAEASEDPFDWLRDQLESLVPSAG